MPLSLKQLWQSAQPSGQPIYTGADSAWPEPVRRYLDHAIAPQTPLATAVRLRMHGEIKLKQWFPFRAEQVIHGQRGLIWQAVVWMKGLPIIGSDRLVDGVAALNWKLLGLLPVVQGAGADIDRSALGRWQAELVWLPSMLVETGVTWRTSGTDLQPRLSLSGQRVGLTLHTSDQGQLDALRLERWGNPEGGEFHAVSFGGVVEQEGTFGGYTIPTRLRAGWYFGTDRFDSDGEFIRITLDQAVFR